MAPQQVHGNRLYPLGSAHHIFALLVLNILYMLCQERIVGGMHGGHYRRPLHYAGGHLVEMDEGWCGQG